MSHVTNIMLSGLFHDIEIEAIRKELAKITTDNFPFLHVDPKTVGGSKSLECDLFIAAIDGLDYDEFLEVIIRIKGIVDFHTWQDLQVFIKNQQDDVWRVFLASDLSIDLF